jgi:elongation of very long chain fatty acids protein 6
MNYGVHAIMYFYYFLTALGYRPKWSAYVTILQISQMFVGIAICFAIYYFESQVRRPWAWCLPSSERPRPHHLSHPFPQGKPCDITFENKVAAHLIYGSYAVLFVAFALEKYVPCGRKKEKSKKAAEKNLSGTKTD